MIIIGGAWNKMDSLNVKGYVRASKKMSRGIQKDAPRYAKRCSGAELLHIFSAAAAYHFYPLRHRFLGAGRHVLRLSGACF